MSHETTRLKTSGDPLADRRFAYGGMLRGAGDLAGAADLFAQTVELAPGWVAAWLALGEARRDLGDVPGAVAAWREALSLDPADPLGVEMKLALAGVAPMPSAPPESYVRALFDDYAPGFERALLGRLDYRAPTMIRAAVDAARPGARFARTLDIGCGTGLTGESLRGITAWLEGIDLAPAMIEQVRAKRVFDVLHLGDVQRFLAAETRLFDLIAAGDVAPYLGDLAPLMALVARRLEPGGLLVLTVELDPESVPSGWRLQPSMRYAHGEDHLQSAAAAAGLRPLSLQRFDLRLDRGLPVPGAVATFELPAAAAVVDRLWEDFAAPGSARPRRHRA